MYSPPSLYRIIYTIGAKARHNLVFEPQFTGNAKVLESGKIWIEDVVSGTEKKGAKI